MPLLFADISSAQHGISIAQLRREGVDGVVIKATGGAGTYTNEYFAEMAAEAISLDMLIGYYHFFVESSYPIMGDGYAEFEHFRKAVQPFMVPGVNLANDLEDVYPAHITAGLDDTQRQWYAGCAAEFRTVPFAYAGTYFWRNNRLDLSAYRLWLPSWQAEIPGPQYHEQHTAIEMWQYTSGAVRAGYRIDLNNYYGTREEWKSRGFQPKTTPVAIGRPAWYSEPVGPWQLWVHQYFHASYNPDLWGEPIGPASDYTDGTIRQAFKNGVWGANSRAEPHPEAAGFALANSSGQPLGTVIADYAEIHPLR